MIKNFQLLIHQVLDSVELNEKTFRDRGSGFDYYPINCRTTGAILEHGEIKINLVAYLIISKHNIHVNIN